MIDYLYVTVDGTHKKLDKSSMHLEFDDHFFANSSLQLSNSENKNNFGRYTVEIKYRCKEYGGALIDYELDIDVPDCGSAKVCWKKICGNPLMPRHGLTMEVEFGQYNQTIVKDG